VNHAAPEHEERKRTSAQSAASYRARPTAAEAIMASMPPPPRATAIAGFAFGSHPGGAEADPSHSWATVTSQDEASASSCSERPAGRLAWYEKPACSTQRLSICLAIGESAAEC